MRRICEDLLPTLALARMPPVIESLRDFRRAQLGAGRVSGELWARGTGECPHSPGARGTEFLSRAAESAGLVLVAEARVAGKVIAAMVLQDPEESGVGQGPCAEDVIRRIHIGIESTGQCQKRATGVTLQPQVMSVAQGIDEKSGIARGAVTAQ